MLLVSVSLFVFNSCKLSYVLVLNPHDLIFLNATSIITQLIVFFLAVLYAPFPVYISLIILFNAGS